MKNILCWLFVSLNVMSCASYKIVSIEELVPAQCEMGQNQNIAYWVRRQSFVNDTSNQYYHTEGLSVDEISLLLYGGINNVLSENGVCDSVRLYMDGVAHLLKDTVQPAPSNIRILTDAIVGITYDKIITLEVIDYKDKKSDFECVSLLRVFDAHTGKILYEKQVDCSLDYMMITKGGYSYMLNALYQAGIDYAKSLVSHWEERSRRIYKGGRELNWANYMALQGSYDEAEDLYNVIESRQKVKALMNKAYIHEMQGMFDMALKDVNDVKKWCKENHRASAISRYASTYAEKLEKRKQIIEKLKTQE